MALLKCDTCGRTGDEVGKCGSFLTCPKAGVPIEATDIVLSCELCSITRVVAAGRVMQGKPLQANPMCPVEVCKARVVFIPKAAEYDDPPIRIGPAPTAEPLATTKAAGHGARTPKGK